MPAGVGAVSNPPLIWGPLSSAPDARASDNEGRDVRGRAACRGGSAALIAWMRFLFEHNEGVKGGFAAAWRFTLDALVVFKNNHPSDQGRCPRSISHVPEHSFRHDVTWSRRRAVRI